MNTKLIMKLLLSNNSDDWVIAYSLIQNDDDRLEWYWIIACLHICILSFDDDDILIFLEDKEGINYVCDFNSCFRNCWKYFASPQILLNEL